MSSVPLLVQLGAISQKCYNTFFTDFNFTDVACIKALVAKGLGYLILLGALAVKVPQILKIVNAKSVKGLALSMFLLELVGYVISLSYGYVKGFPFSSYGETGLILIQNYIILFLMYAYGGGVGLMFLLISVGTWGGLYVLGSGLVPIETLQYLQGSTIGIFAISKIPQIIANFQNKSTGQLAFITFFLNFLGSLARIFTTIQETNDITLLAGFISGATLNGIILLQIIMYGNAEAKPAGGKPAKAKKTD